MKYLHAIDAKEDLDIMRKNLLEGTCPVFKSRCIDNNCNSLVLGEVINFREYPSTDPFLKIIPPRCTCALVTGVIQHEGCE